MSLISIMALSRLSSSLGGVTFVLISVVCATYCISQGLAEFGRGGYKGDWKSPELQIFLYSIIIIGHKSWGADDLFLPVVSAIVCLAGFNIGRGLAEHYRSKVSTVFNR